MAGQSVWDEIERGYLIDEQSVIDSLLLQFAQTDNENTAIKHLSQQLIEAIRAGQPSSTLFQSFLQEYDLGTREGVLLMCLAESLIRIPDAHTANKLISDKLTGADWVQHLGKSPSFLVNASSWGLMLTGKWMSFKKEEHLSPKTLMAKFLAKTSEPIMRTALQKAMTLMGKQFVMGQEIKEALVRSQQKEFRRYRFSFDMLGEAALTKEDAEKYFHSYANAIEAIGQYPDKERREMSISIKLSALHPKYETTNAQRVLEELYATCLQLVEKAYKHDVAVTIDAEEAFRLELSLQLFEKIYTDGRFKHWEQLGLAVQAYQKRATHVIEWLVQLAKQHGKKIPVRLVKGAYWDTEIKRAQQLGLTEYPLYTRKSATDLSYLACAQNMLNNSAQIYSQFATHNAHTVASIVTYAKRHAVSDFEFQRLHGMGHDLYDALEKLHAIPCRVYAPVGDHKELLPYLIRRLLENGANSSFVHQLTDNTIPINTLIQEPKESLCRNLNTCVIERPENIYQPVRQNSQGFDIQHQKSLTVLEQEIAAHLESSWQAEPVSPSYIDADSASLAKRTCYTPFDSSRAIGTVVSVDSKIAKSAIETAKQYAEVWGKTPVDVRAQCLMKLADLYEQNRAELIALCMLEAGKTLQDAIDEIREAIDFCRYYVYQATLNFAQPLSLMSPTGEQNLLSWEAKGVFVCISPWNFPLAIFTGQVAAALVMGNCVIAKPAEQSQLIACYASQLFLQSGIPAEAIQCLPGKGSELGPILTGSTDIAGVAFTGSTETAHRINSSMTERKGVIGTLIAETGGQNAMIVDSSALPEQVVRDIIESAFKSAGQRCSALRVLFIQEDIADSMLTMLRGAMEELVIGDPTSHLTDIGPVIDQKSADALNAYIEAARCAEKPVFQLEQGNKNQEQGSFVSPCYIEINSILELTEEQFGPILHIVRYKPEKIDSVIADINAVGYGLTLGIQTRVESFADDIARRVKVGNVYINRNMIGAVVGVQPFGGRGLSGTGPKAGGPNYLPRFATEKTITRNTAAIGGNIELLNHA